MTGPDTRVVRRALPCLMHTRTPGGRSARPFHAYLRFCAGNPKGVVITHATLLACVTGLQGYIREVGVDIRPGDTILSYLTLAHIFGRAVEEFCLSVGAAIGYWQARGVYTDKNVTCKYWCLSVGAAIASGRYVRWL